MNSQTKIFPFSTNSCSPKAECLTGEQMGGQLMILGSLATSLCLQTCRKPPQRLGIILSTYWLTFQG